MPAFSRPSTLLRLSLSLACVAAPLFSQAANTLQLVTTQVTNTGPECAGGGSYYPSLDEKGRKIAFISYCDLVHGQNANGNAQLFIQKTSGGGLRQLTHIAGGSGVVEPSLSPDGELIAFASSSDLVAGGNTDGNFEIFLIRADGTGLAQLTNTTGGRTQFGFQGNTHPIFDPTGRFIVFSSDRDLVPGGNADGNNDLFMIGTNGSGVRQLTATTGGWGVETGMLDSTGQRIVFDSDRDLVGQNPDLGYEIYTMHVDGSALQQLTNSDSSGGQLGNSFPRWTADGESIFFNSDQALVSPNPGMIGQVYHMNGDGSNIVQVTSCFGVFGATPWGVAEDGRMVAIESDCDLVPGANLDRNGEVFVETWKPAQFTPTAPPASRAANLAAQAAPHGPRAMRAPKI